MGTDAVQVVRVTADNWRALAALTVTEDQAEFVAPVAHYLNLGAYGGVWQPLAIERCGSVVGFVMLATDQEDGSRWVGGLIVDRTQQRRGVARAALMALVEQARQDGYPSLALSYEPANTGARNLYAALGFVETGERQDDGAEIVARLVFPAAQWR